MSPLQLSMLIHYAVSGEEWECKTPTHEEIRNELIDMGLLQKGNQWSKNLNFSLTAKGSFHIDHLLKHELPRETFTYEPPE